MNKQKSPLVPLYPRGLKWTGYTASAEEQLQSHQSLRGYPCPDCHKKRLPGGLVFRKETGDNQCWACGLVLVTEWEWQRRVADPNFEVPDDYSRGDFDDEFVDPRIGRPHPCKRRSKKKNGYRRRGALPTQGPLGNQPEPQPKDEQA